MFLKQRVESEIVEKKLRLTISYDELIKILLFLYFCGLNAHKRGYGFDAIFCRLTFIMLMGTELLYLIKNRIAYINGVFRWYLGFILFYFLSVFWSVKKDDIFAIEIMFNFIQILGVVFVMGNHIKTEKDYKWVFQSFLWSLIYMSVLLIIRTPINEWGTERVGGVMALNSNDIGLRTSVAVILSLCFAKEKKYFYIVAVVFAIIALLSGSRKAFIMIVLEVGLFFLGKDKGWKTLVNVILAIIGVGILFYVVFNVPIFYDVLGKRLESTFNDMLGMQTYNIYGQLVRDYSGNERAQFRNLAMAYFLERPICGLGGNGFVTQMRIIGFKHVAYSHCNYTELLCTLGVCGFVLYYGLPFKRILQGIRVCWKRKNEDRLFSAVTIIGIVFLIIDYYYVSYYSVFTLIVLSLTISYIKSKHSEVELRT